MSNCPPDVNAIQAHFQDGVGWNAFPILGPIFAGPFSRPLPADGSADLSAATDALNAATAAFDQAAANVMYDNSNNIHELSALFDPYIDIKVQLDTLADHQLLYIVALELAVLFFIVFLIFFRVIH